ncbi:MAG: iron-containing alcohol dehydrogenase [Deltaproteobacteria bacterium]|nr:iron-containing alcohol dehydrogenase [Deltaproteobacteria bacterium]NCP03044.1 iron-containing alcohol dehydrogenase [Deltaproteobacteria bacterium]
MEQKSLHQHCKFEVPEIIFGRGLLQQVGSCARRLGGKKVFLVSDQGLFQAGWVDLAIRSLQDAGMKVVYFDQITSNPKDYEIEAGLREYVAQGSDVIVGLGGGSALDAAKGIAILSANGGQISDYKGNDKIHRPLPPLVLCPTTCGTGSDVSQFAVINDTGEMCKFTIMSRCIAPDISLTDPDTLRTLPDEYIGSTAIDALSHAVEAYFSVASSTLTDVNALQALTLLTKSFIPAVQERHADNLEDLSRASLHAGMAFSNALLGIGHALAHPIGGLYDANHGDVNAVLLPEVLKFDFPVVRQKIAGMVNALGYKLESNEKFAEEMTIETVEKILAAAGVPRGLRNIGVKQEDLSKLAARAMNDVCLLTSPRQTDVDDLLGILKRSY